MFRFSEMLRPLSCFVSLILVPALCLQTACNNGSPNTLTSRTGGNYRIISHEIDAKQSLANDNVQNGRYVIEMEGQEPHQVAFSLRQAITKGEGDLTVEVIDETAGSSSLFVINDEAATVQIQSTGGSKNFVVNADESVTVDGSNFPSMVEAANATVSSPALNAISNESLAAIHSLVNGGSSMIEGTSRGGAVVYIVTFAWLGTSQTLCAREFRRNNGQLGQLSQYCRGWCTAYWCW
jgi:hypothetical protein